MIEDKTFEEIKQLLKEDNTLSSEEIQAKLKYKDKHASASITRRAFKSRKPNIEEKNLLNANQKKIRKNFR